MALQRKISTGSGITGKGIPNDELRFDPSTLTAGTQGVLGGNGTANSYVGADGLTHSLPSNPISGLNIILTGDSGADKTIESGNPMYIGGFVGSLLTTVTAKTNQVLVQWDTSSASSGQVPMWDGDEMVWTTPSSAVALATSDPLADTVATGTAGTSPNAARQDHTHPFSHNLALTQADGLVYTHNGNDTNAISFPPGIVVQNIGFDSNGNPVRSQASEVVVDFSVNADPNTVGTTFNPNTPATSDVIYTSTINNSTWTWNGSSYVTYTPPNKSAWYLAGTTIDAGGNKTSNITRTGRVSIGSSSSGVPVAYLETITESTTGGFANSRYANDAAGANITLRKARGTRAAPSATLSGDTLGALNLQGYTGSTFVNGIQFQPVAAENWTSTARGSRLNILVNRVGTATIDRPIVIGEKGISICDSPNFGSAPAPTEALDVYGNAKFSLALMPAGLAGTSGQVLTSSGSNLAPTWTTPTALSSTTPVADAVTTGVVGVGTTAARSDHQHPFSHSLALTQAGGLVYTHNNDAKTVTISAGVVAQNIGFDSSGNPVITAVGISNRTGACTGVSVAFPNSVIVPYTAPVSSVSGFTWVSASNSWQVTTAGVYSINATAHFESLQNWGTHQSGVVSGSICRIVLYKNGTIFANGRDTHISFNGNISSGIICTIDKTIVLAANDTVQIRAYQDSNASKTISNIGAEAYFEIVKMQ